MFSTKLNKNMMNRFVNTPMCYLAFFLHCKYSCLLLQKCTSEIEWLCNQLYFCRMQNMSFGTHQIRSHTWGGSSENLGTWSSYLESEVIQWTACILYKMSRYNYWTNIIPYYIIPYIACLTKIGRTKVIGIKFFRVTTISSYAFGF